MISIGERIREELERQERSVTWFARKLNCNRATIYRMLSKNSIDTQMLMQASMALHVNFFHELSDEMAERLKKLIR